MRLTSKDIAAIEQAAHEAFVSRSTVRLFGSRLDDAWRGGRLLTTVAG
jgi:hypothetical protein